MCTKPFSQTKSKGKQFLVAKSSGPLLARMPLNTQYFSNREQEIETANILLLRVPHKMSYTYNETNLTVQNNRMAGGHSKHRYTN